MPATSYPLSLHDALPIFGLGPDEREQGGAVDVELFVRAGDRHALQRRLAVERGDRGPDVDVDAGVRLDSVDEVPGHRRVEGSPYDDVHRRAALGEVHRGLAGGVAAADDDDRFAAAPSGL